MLMQTRDAFRRNTLATSVSYGAGERVIRPSRRVLLERLSAKENSMEPVVPALAINERYFLGCIARWRVRCATGSRRGEGYLKVLDGGISQASRDMLERLVTPQFLIPKHSDWRMTRCS